MYLCTTMAESLITAPAGSTKADRYRLLIPQLEALVSGENDLIANLSNIVAALKESFGFFWVGFYFVKGDQLVLGPFQGPVACTRIGFGKGVCGAAWKEKKILVVADVDAFPGHIACSSLSKSEIVLPALRNNEVFLVLDIDSTQPADFDNDDEHYLQQVINLIQKL
mgnify:CR=1 FL=1